MVLMSDQARLPNIKHIVTQLPAPTLVVIRDYTMSEREGYAQEITTIAHRAGHRVLIGDDVALALRLRADGVHLPEKSLEKLNVIKENYPAMLVTVAVHHKDTLEKATQADVLFISPVFETESHPGEPVLEVDGFNQLAAAAEVPCYALGGINVQNIDRLINSSASGVAGISLFDGSSGMELISTP